MTTDVPRCDYEGSHYQQEFWNAARQYEDMAERIALRHLLPASGRRIVEIGAGAGRLGDLYQGYDEIYLVDYARSQLEQAHARWGHDPRFTFVQGDIYRLPGLSHVPVIVREATEQEMLEWALIENIQREDLNAFEEALAYQQMVEYSRLTQEEIARRVGKNRSTVTNTMRLLQLPEPVQQMLRRGDISEGHARAILGLDHASDMMAVAEQVVKQGLNVRQTEAIVKRMKEPPQPREHSENMLSLHDRELQKQFRNALSLTVDLKRKKKGGEIVIHFDDDEDLQALYEKLLGE